MREQFTLVESLLNEQVLKIYAGNQHACCITERYDPIIAALKELKGINNEGSTF